MKIIFCSTTGNEGFPLFSQSCFDFPTVVDNKAITQLVKLSRIHTFEEWNTSPERKGRLESVINYILRLEQYFLGTLVLRPPCTSRPE